MADFTDLVFTPHGTFPDGAHAELEFPNGYGISVVTGSFAYTDSNGPYEIAVVLHGALCYDTPVTDDVLGWQTSDDINTVMAQIETLPTP